MKIYTIIHDVDILTDKTKNLYRNADGILFVFDVTNEETFHHIKNWLITFVNDK